MNQNAIQKYAIWARNELIEQVKQRAYQYGISDKGYDDENATVIAGRVLSSDEKRQRAAFIGEIKRNGFPQAVEEVAYTWFNRFVALRFMEVNDYLPTHVRVFSDANGNFNPEILKDVLHLELKGLDKSKVSEMLNANQTEELYRYLLLTQCNALNEVLPEIFEKLGSYTEMLFPNNILKSDSVLGRLVTDIPEEDWKDAVEIIGWMYQYYNTEPKQAVFDGLKNNIKITKEKIPAATQLFTPDWIVRYMVENSLGRLWIESHPNDTLKANWKYYLDEAEQTPEVAEKLRVLRSQSLVKSPEDIKVIDPCMGSGHILVYAFDVLMQIYESEGYNPRDAAKLILEKNIYGLDIDRRAYQLAYFALMMKSRQYNRRIFDEDIKPQVYHPTGFPDGEEYGSLVKIDMLPPKPEQPKDQLTFFDDYERDLRVWNFKRLLTQKYDVVVTNPPYMGGRGQSARTSEYLKDNFPDTKSDTFSAFIERCGQMAKPMGYVGMFTPYVWMFIQSYEKLRKNIYDTKNITTLIQFEYSAFEEATVPVCSFVYRNMNTGEKGGYFRLVDFRGGMEIQRQKYIEALENPDCGFFYISSTKNFEKIPGRPVAYWASEAIMQAFNFGKLIGNIAEVKIGMGTGKNDIFVREWWEVIHTLIDFSLKNIAELDDSEGRYFPYNKGGDYRLWYGNLQQVLWFNAEGRTYMSTMPGHRENGGWNYYFKQGLTWSFISSSKFGVRLLPYGFTFDVAGSTLFVDDKNLKYLLGFLTSVVCFEILSMLNPTLNYQAGNIKSLPLKLDNGKHTEVTTIVDTNISLSRTDWDSFETSWDFERHPLVRKKNRADNNVCLCLKIGEKKWIEKLHKGTICFSPVEDFIQKAIETGNDEQGDKYEGVFARLKLDDPRISDMETRLGSDLEKIADGEYMLLRRRSVRCVPVFCLYGVFEEDLQPTTKKLKIDSNGDYSASVRHDIDQRMFNNFVQGCDKAIDSKNICGFYCSVGHLDEIIELELLKRNVKYKKYRVKYEHDYMDDDIFFFEPTTNEYNELKYKARRFNYQHEIRYVLLDTHQNDKFLLPYEPVPHGVGGVAQGTVSPILNVKYEKLQIDLISEGFELWKKECNDRFIQLKSNEEELNRIFIDIYGLQDELTPEVEDKDVTVYRIFDDKEDIPESMAGSRYALTKQDAIKSFISYAVGCMFGRYSLDTEGLAYAGGEWDSEKYKTFIPDKDNVIPICDDEYFDDDILGRFLHFVRVVYGEDTLEENLQFIADALGGRGTPREVIRNYFLNDFYKDHCKIYQKRPIYWLFDSGKKNGFKALIYMHRYSRHLLAKLRIDYVHEQQERYRTQLSHIVTALNTATGAERARLLKQQDKLTEQFKEITAFEEKVHHLADQNIEIDLDDGVKKNYKIFEDVLAKI